MRAGGLREIREGRYLTLHAAAFVIGCSPGHLGRIERKLRGASPGMMRRIAGLYRLEVRDVRRLCKADGRGRPRGKTRSR